MPVRKRTAAELRVLRKQMAYVLWMEGYNSGEISQAMAISADTVARWIRKFL